MKRTSDFIAAACGFVLLSPLLLSLAVLIKLTSRGPVFFCQQRVGRDFRPFFIYKFRTMVPDAPARGASITVGRDPRITAVGRILRRTKLDELPQLLNVLKGDMSLVGPRPEVSQYVELFRDDYADILRVRPGITDLASLTFRDEAAVLAQAADPETAYVRQILPEKIRLAREYVRRQSLIGDFSLILRTVLQLLGDRIGVAAP